MKMLQNFGSIQWDKCCRILALFCRYYF